MAEGRWSVDCDYDQVVNAEFEDATGNTKNLRVQVEQYDPVALTWGLIYTGVLTDKLADRDGIHLAGSGQLWWLGSGSGRPGPLIRDREFVSGNNKLSNGDFGIDVSYWRFPTGSPWTISTTGGNLSPACALLSTTTGPAEAVLQSGETFEALPGQQLIMTASVKSTAPLGGRLRGRIVCEGRFAQPDRSSAYTAWSAAQRGDIYYETDPQGIVAGPVLRIQTAVPNLITNGDFENSFVGWNQGAGNWFSASAYGAWSGANYVMTNTSAAGQSKMLSWGSSNIATSFTVIAGEEYEFWTVARANPLPALNDTNGEAYCMIGIFDVAPAAPFPPSNMASTLYVKSPVVRAPGLDGNQGKYQWQIVKGSYTVAVGQTAMSYYLQVTNQTLGQWDFDSATLIRTKGNWDFVTGPQIFGTPGRTYRWTVPYRIDASVTSATVQLRAVCRGPAVPVLIMTGPTISQSAGISGLQSAVYDITLPAGYDNFIPEVYVEDVHSGAYFLGRGTIFDTDPTTSVFDTVTDAAWPTFTTLNQTRTVPVGTERVRVEMVADPNAGAWTVDDVALYRTGVAFSTAASVVNALLLDPDTGQPLPVTAGTITGGEIIPRDWRVVNRQNRDALELLSTVIAFPKREFRINPNGTMDWGTSAQVFVDHSPSSSTPIVLLEFDLDVAQLPGAARSSADRASKVIVIGGSRPAATGQQTQITATAPAPVIGADWNGRPINRSLLVEDSTVDHLEYGQALATDAIARQAAPATTIAATLTGSRTRPSFDVGDWVYAYNPESGLTDPANPTTVEGRVVFPVRLRVLGRSVTLGSGYRIRIRRDDGSTFLLAGARFEPANATSLELGNRRGEFSPDAAGGDTGRQYLAFRASAPR